MSAHRFDLSAIGAGLPVARAEAEIEAAIATGAAVITAPPGTGKTTFVPALTANFVTRLARASAGSQTTLLSQPRRVAVRAAARRLASLDGSQIGGPVGFTVRGERSVGPDTVLEALTPGVLLRRLLSDPSLEGVGAVILDEIHERSVDSDILLGMLAEVRELRPDLTVVAMSATLDSAATSELLDAKVVDVPSPLHPLSIEYAPAPGQRLDDRGVSRDFLAHVAELAVTEQAASGSDALVFLPGAREVDEVARIARDLVSQNGASPVDILPLHGRLSSREQDRAVSGRHAHDAPRIIVSTALAESSLTVPGVRLVIDAGLSREARRDQARDMTGLVTVSASRASAEQRAGRAAREGAGRAIRAFSETDFARMPATLTPEILSADLTDAALLLAAWGTPGAAGLRLATPAPPAALARALATLRSLELTDANDRVTALGSRVAGLPFGVREARALLQGVRDSGDPDRVGEIVAAFSGDYRASDADLATLLRALRTGRQPGADRWRGEAKRLAKIASDELRGAPETHGDAARDSSSGGRVTALARPEWIARRTAGHSRSYLFASGTRAALPEGSPLAASEWIAVREVQRAEGRAADGTGAVIRLAASITAEDAVEIGGSLRSRSRIAKIDSGKVRVREEDHLGAILLSSSPAAPRPDDAGPAFAAHLRETGLTALNWTTAAGILRARLALLHRELHDPWPDVSDLALLDTIPEWLGPDLSGMNPKASLAALDVTSALRRLLPWPEAARLDDLVPERLPVPSGSTVAIDYAPALDAGGRPIVAVKLQEVFGLAETPRLVSGRVPVLFHLLSPARRPLAVTDDLASFWDGPYQDVRREMRGKYPKHPWPEDPWAAEATAKTKRAAERGG
ncbi:ATP-dependent helicase HrpB [Leucobacter sp. NPDC015123]|uniref:ATP-dependent helicase HrpB n=1 Tax=Leucobacter sp. NPDC015123 TaxID=3364129 RepID=UPI0036F49872